MASPADIVNLLIGLYGAAKRYAGGSRGDRLERVERLTVFVAQRLPLLEERLGELESLVDDRLSSLRQELETILQAKLEELKTLVDERLASLGVRRRIVYVTPSISTRPLVAVDAGFVAEPRFSTRPLGHVDVSILEPRLEIREAGDRGQGS